MTRLYLGNFSFFLVELKTSKQNGLRSPKVIFFSFLLVGLRLTSLFILYKKQSKYTRGRIISSLQSDPGLSVKAVNGGEQVPRWLPR